MRLTIDLDPWAAALYDRVAQTAGLELTQVLADALFRLAGELAMEAAERKQTSNP